MQELQPLAQSVQSSAMQAKTITDEFDQKEAQFAQKWGAETFAQTLTNFGCNTADPACTDILKWE